MGLSTVTAQTHFALWDTVFETTVSQYADANRQAYLNYARGIVPDYTDPNAIWDRAAFSVLSAHAPFNVAVKALHALRPERQAFDRIIPLGHTPAKAQALKMLPTGDATVNLLRGAESWHEYRLRLVRPGLGLCKATFLACLLYPLTADLACIDTHMKRVLTGERKELRQAAYLAAEDRVRVLARHINLPTFIMQWAMWDCARGTVTDHAIF